MTADDRFPLRAVSHRRVGEERPRSGARDLRGRDLQSRCERAHPDLEPHRGATLRVQRRGDRRSPAASSVFADHLRDEVERVIDTGIAGDRVDHFETEILRKDGMPVPISLSLCPVLDDDGTPAAVVLIGRDITEQRLAQASLAEVEARVPRERGVGERRQLAVGPPDGHGAVERRVSTASTASIRFRSTGRSRRISAWFMPRTGNRSGPRWRRRSSQVGRSNTSIASYDRTTRVRCPPRSWSSDDRVRWLRGRVARHRAGRHGSRR